MLFRSGSATSIGQPSVLEDHGPVWNVLDEADPWDAIGKLLNLPAPDRPSIHGTQSAAIESTFTSDGRAGVGYRNVDRGLIAEKRPSSSADDIVGIARVDAGVLYLPARLGAGEAFSTMSGHVCARFRSGSPSPDAENSELTSGQTMKTKITNFDQDRKSVV